MRHSSATDISHTFRNRLIGRPVSISVLDHIPGALLLRIVTTHIVNIVVGEIPLFERAEAEIGVGQLIDKKRGSISINSEGTVVPDTFAVLLPPKNTGASI